MSETQPQHENGSQEAWEEQQRLKLELESLRQRCQAAEKAIADSMDAQITLEEDSEAAKTDIRRLQQDIDRKKLQYQHENRMLGLELDQADTLPDRFSSKDLSPLLEQREQVVNAAQDCIQSGNVLMGELALMQERYRRYKTMSTALHQISLLQNEYERRFGSLRSLRRNLQGYISGANTLFFDMNQLDQLQLSEEFLQNTHTWLDYAAIAVVYWAQSEQTPEKAAAARRAVREAVRMDRQKASLFFLLLNLRYDRTDAAEQWFHYFLRGERDDHLRGEEWSYILQAYLTNAWKAPALRRSLLSVLQRDVVADPTAQRRYYLEARDRMQTWIGQFPAGSPVAGGEALKQSCSAGDYRRLMEREAALTRLEQLVRWLEQLKEAETHSPACTQHRIDAVLEELIASPSEEEQGLLDALYENRFLVDYGGDRSAVKARLAEERKRRGRHRPLQELLLDWALAPAHSNVPAQLQCFALSVLRQPLLEGLSAYCRDTMEQMAQPVTLLVEEYAVTCSMDPDCTDAPQEEQLEHLLQRQQLNALLSRPSFWIPLFGLLLGLGLLWNLWETGSIVAGLLGLLGTVSGGGLLYLQVSRAVRLLRKRRYDLRLILQAGKAALSDWQHNTLTRARQQQDRIATLLQDWNP